MKVNGILFLFLAAFVVAGCAPSQTIPPILPSPMDGNTPTPLPLPTQADNLPMPNITPGLQALILKARADLAIRLSIPLAEINLVKAAEVIWPDASLGCPKKDMAYAQVLMPGSLILLEYANHPYEYHAGRGSDVFYCPNPTPPVPGSPGNT